MKTNHLYLGDCIEIMSNEMKPESVDLIFADPPYNLSEVMIVLKQLDFKVNNIITWQKTNAMPNMTRRVFTHSTEFVVWAVKGKKWIFNYEELRKIHFLPLTAH